MTIQHTCLYLISRIYHTYNTLTYWVGFKRVYQIDVGEITLLYHVARFLEKAHHPESYIGTHICDRLKTYTGWRVDRPIGICEYRDRQYVRYIVPPQPIRRLVTYTPKTLISLPYHDIKKIEHIGHNSARDTTIAKSNFYDADGIATDLIVMMKFFYIMAKINMNGMDQTTVQVHYDSFDIDTLEQTQYTKNIQFTL